MKYEQINVHKKYINIINNNNNMPGDTYIKNPITTKNKQSSNERTTNPLTSPNNKSIKFYTKGNSKSPHINKNCASLKGQLQKEQNLNRTMERRRNKSDNTWKKLENNNNYKNIQNTKK